MQQTVSPVNGESIAKQRQKLLAHLEAGNTIHFIQAREMGIGFLNSRMAEIRKGRSVYDKWVRIGDTKCKLYSLRPFQSIVHSSYPESYED